MRFFAKENKILLAAEESRKQLQNYRQFHVNDLIVIYSKFIVAFMTELINCDHGFTTGFNTIPECTKASK